MFELRTKYGKLQILDASTAEAILSEHTNGKNLTFHFVNAYVLTEANKDSKYFGVLSNGLCFCDSRILEVYSRITSTPIRQLRGIDFMKDCLPRPDMGSQLIIGGTQKSELELVTLVSEYFRKQVNLSFHQPEFSSDISVLLSSSILAIKRNKPKTIWLGVGTPKQDYLASRLKSEFDGNIFCVGAAISFLVGDVLESPKWIQQAGLEWFYRLVREPGRLWRRYLFGNIFFSGMLIKDLAFRIFST